VIAAITADLKTWFSWQQGRRRALALFQVAACVYVTAMMGSGVAAFFGMSLQTLAYHMSSLMAVCTVLSVMGFAWYLVGTMPIRNLHRSIEHRIGARLDVTSSTEHVPDEMFVRADESLVEYWLDRAVDPLLTVGMTLVILALLSGLPDRYIGSFFAPVIAVFLLPYLVRCHAEQVGRMSSIISRCEASLNVAALTPKTYHRLEAPHVEVSEPFDERHGLAAILFLGIGIFLWTFFDWQVARHVDGPPKRVDLADLEAGGYEGNGHIAIGQHIAFYPAAAYSYRTLFEGQKPSDGTLLNSVYYPILSLQDPYIRRLRTLVSLYGDFSSIPKDSLPKPESFTVLVATNRWSTRVDIPDDLVVEDDLTGLIVNEIDSLPSKSRNAVQLVFPKVDFSKVLIVHQDKRPWPLAICWSSMLFGAFLVAYALVRLAAMALANLI